MIKRIFLTLCMFWLCAASVNAQEALKSTRAASLDQAVTLETLDGTFIDLLEVQGADIKDVLRAISNKTLFQIVVDEEIKGKVDIFLTDVEVPDALRIILEKLDLTFSEETILVDGAQREVIRVLSEEAFEQRYGYAFGHKVQTRIVPLVYIEAGDIIDILQQLKTSAGKIILNEETNTLILMDNPKALTAMESIIKELDVPIETREFVLKRGNVIEIVDTVKERLTKGVGRIEIDKENNSLSVTDTLLQLKEIESLISDFDLVGKKIIIDVKVIQITLSDEHETGVDWEAIVSSYASLSFKAFDSARILPKEKELISLGTITKEDLLILTEALETVGEIKTVFVDQLSAKNRESVHFIIPEESIASVEENHSLENHRMSKDDVKFYLSAKIEDENIIAMSIQPSVFVIADEESIRERRQNILIRGVTRGANFLRSATRVIPGLGDGEKVQEGDLVEKKFDQNATINVEDGSTVVIGGMVKEVLVKSVRKIPLLGDLPILGFAFQTEGEQLRNTEVIVFLTLKVSEE